LASTQFKAVGVSGGLFVSGAFVAVQFEHQAPYPDK